MKYRLSFYALVLISLTGQAQMVTDVPNNILYVGTNNTFRIAVNAYDIKQLRLKASFGELTQKNDVFSWQTCDTLKKILTITCYYGKKKIDSGLFRIKRAPTPIILVKPFDSDFTHATDRPRMVLAKINDWPFDNNFQIKEYTVILVKSNTDTTYYKNHGAGFSNDLKIAVGNLKKGDKYRVINVIALGQCPNLDLKLKDTEFYNID